MIIFPRKLEMYILQHNLRHVAIAVNGIFIDESVAPHSRGLIQRTIIRYEDIQDCYVSLFALESRRDVVVKLKN
jgi:hypothetical protein